MHFMSMKLKRRRFRTGKAWWFLSCLVGSDLGLATGRRSLSDNFEDVARLLLYEFKILVSIVIRCLFLDVNGYGS